MALNLAQRFERAAGRPVPDQLSNKAAQAWQHVHWYIGGQPRLLCFFLEALQPDPGIISDRSQRAGIRTGHVISQYNPQPLVTPARNQDIIIGQKLLVRHVSNCREESMCGHFMRYILTVSQQLSSKSWPRFGSFHIRCDMHPPANVSQTQKGSVEPDALILSSHLTVFMILDSCLCMEQHIISPEHHATCAVDVSRRCRGM